MTCLRPYQSIAVDQLRAAIKQNPLAVAPCGSGKTVIFSAIIERVCARQRRTLFLVDREELIQNTAAELAKLNIHPGIIKAGYRESRDRPVQVASVQSLNRRSLPHADLLIIDEADLCLARTWLELIQHYESVPRIGGTATPCRLDGRGLGSVFGCIVQVATTQELIDGGYLIEPVLYTHPLAPDLESVPSKDGDYVPAKVAPIVEGLIGNSVDHYRAVALGTRAIGFAVNRQHSHALTDAFNAAGIPAEHLDGNTHPTRRRDVLERLRAGPLVVFNCDLFGRGTNLPTLDCAIDCAPTKSLARWWQRVGRVMRFIEGKTAIYLDHAGNFRRLGWITEAPVWSLSDRVRRPSAGGYRTCLKCYRIWPVGTMLCACGAALSEIVSPIPEIHRGDLIKVDPRLTESTFYTDVLRRAATIKSARGAFKSRFGKWPRLRDLEKKEFTCDVHKPESFEIGHGWKRVRCARCLEPLAGSSLQERAAPTLRFQR